MESCHQGQPPSREGSSLRQREQGEPFSKRASIKESLSQREPPSRRATRAFITENLHQGEPPSRRTCIKESRHQGEPSAFIKESKESRITKENLQHPSRRAFSKESHSQGKPPAFSKENLHWWDPRERRASREGSLQRGDPQGRRPFDNALDVQSLLINNVKQSSLLFVYVSFQGIGIAMWESVHLIHEKYVLVTVFYCSSFVFMMTSY